MGEWEVRAAKIVAFIAMGTEAGLSRLGAL